MDNIITNNTIRSILLTVLVVLMITAMAGSASAYVTSVTVTSPDGGENWSGTQTIEWTVGGSGDSTDYYTISYSDNGGTNWYSLLAGGQVLDWTSRSYSWDTTSRTDDTDYLIRVFATSNSTTYNDASNATFTIDNTAPTVAIDTPTDGQNVSSDTIWINGTYSDATSGVDNSSLVVKVNGTEITGGTNTSGYYNYSATISSLSEGSHSITVDVNDFAVNTGQGTSSFTVDRSAPTLSIWIPTGNTTDSTPWINATFGDGSGTGVNVSATVLIVNGTDKTVNTTVNNDTDIAYEVESALDDGTIPVNISITDYMGNTTWGNWTFVVDTGLPTLGTLDTPTEDDNVSTSTVWINGTYTDTGSGVNTSSLIVKVNGSVPAFDSTSRTGGYYNHSITLPDGDHNVTVDVSDYAGNDAAQKLVNFTVDAEAPTFSIRIPTGNITDSTPWVNATFADDGTGVNASATVLIVNGTDKTVNTTVNNDTDIAYEVESALDDGTIAVNISITDYNDHTTWGNWTFVVDTGLPTLGTLDTPTEDDNVSTSTVWINGTYTDTGSGVNTSSLVVKVNGSVPAFDSTSRTSGYYNYSATLPDGNHNATVDVSDYAGNDAAQKLVNFTVDAEDPIFSIWIPTGNITDSTPWINATFDDTGTGVNVSATTVTVNGTEVTSSLTVNTSTNVSYHANLNDSTHTVNISITDYAGKTVWKNWTFAVDTGLPTLGLDTPTEDQNVSTSTVWINGTYTDTTSGVNTSSLVVKVNGSVPAFDSTSRTSGYYNYSATLPDGSHNVTVDVNDYADNAATQELVNFTVDTQAPSVTASPPTTYPGTQTAAKTGDTVTLNATVTDAGSGVSSVTVNVSTINSTHTSVTLTQVGSTDYYDGTVIVGTPSSGTMSCAVNATDNCGYSNTSISLSVTVDNTAPSTPVVTDDGASTTSTTQLNATWSSDSESGIAEYFYAIGNTSGGTEIVDWTSTGTTAGINKTGLTSTVGHTYYFTVKAQNGAGDNSTAGNSDGITVLTSATTSYDINLVPGWNMVSTPLMPDNTAIATVLSGMHNVLIVYAYDTLNETWLRYLPESGSGDLADITAGKGYWFEMNASETLTIHGSFLPAGETPPTYPVYTGWNLIGFHSLSADSPYDYLSNVRGNYASKMYGYKNGVWVTVNNADVVTGTDDLEPGYGYWLYMQQNGTIAP